MGADMVRVPQDRAQAARTWGPVNNSGYVVVVRRRMSRMRTLRVLKSASKIMR